MTKRTLILATLAPLLVAAPAFAADSGFVSMSGFPAFAQTADAAGMSAFLNALYQYLIGIAIVLAVVEIMWGGFLWMGSGASVTSKDKGLHKIQMSLVGLLLVLSPVIIFNLINPKILSLQIGTTNLEPPPLNKITETKNAQQVVCESVRGGTYYGDSSECAKNTTVLCASIEGGGTCGVPVANSTLTFGAAPVNSTNITSVYFLQYAGYQADAKCWKEFPPQTFFNTDGETQCKQQLASMNFDPNANPVFLNKLVNDCQTTLKLPNMDASMYCAP
ncbi:MAG TPA: TrbC/VirB2 family protein [Candidatus Paceibacterota bacterium]